MNKTNALLVIGLSILMIGVIALWSRRGDVSMQSQPPQQIACTMEAKLCPDGSYIGRVGPLCEFAACPSVITGPTSTTSTIPSGTLGWEAVTDQKQKIEFQYPESLMTQFISTQKWPPTITVKSGVFNCKEARTINARSYCVTIEDEGAAGSKYRTYTYTTTLKPGTTTALSVLATLQFVLRFPQCYNYDNSNQTACLNEQSALNIDTLVDQMVGTIKQL